MKYIFLTFIYYRGSRRPLHRHSRWSLPLSAPVALVWFIPLILLFTLRTPVSAQELIPLIEGLQQNYQSHQGWQTDFSQSTFVELLGRDVKRDGVMTIQKPGKLRVEYRGEGARFYLSDGKKLWVYSPEEKQVEIFPKVSKIVAKEALAFLGGLGDIAKEFVVGPVLDEDEKKLFKTKTLKLLTLIPKDEKSFLQKVVLGTDDNFTVREMTLTNESGNVTHYIFKNVSFDPKSSDDMFVYKKQEGVKEVKY